MSSLIKFNNDRLLSSLYCKNDICVFLSPHCDDICFSLGAFISAFRPEGILVTVFTKSMYSRLQLSVLTSLELIETVTALRKEEDVKYAQSNCLVRNDLGLPEPAVRGIRPFGPADKETLDLYAEGVLNALLRLGAERAGENGRRAILFAPLGVGNHIDHVWVAHLIANNLGELNSYYSTVFYEELPYACTPGATEFALKAIAKETRVALMPNLAWTFDGLILDAKRASIESYETQLGVFPPVCYSFRESLWMVTQ